MRVVILIMLTAGTLMASFVKDGDVVHDTKLGLTWQDANASKTIKLNFENALKYCENLTLMQKSDWRLPSIKELQSIVDFTQFKPAVNKTFQNTIHRLYWSSTLYAGDPNRAWYVYFYDGKAHYYLKANSSYIRCVRDK